MRQNPSFAFGDVDQLRRTISENPWATLIGHDDTGVTVSHYAVLLDPSRDDLTVVAHVGRPDDAVLGLGEGELTLVFQGPHGYITPRWYGDIEAVPTWNFTAIHLTGVPEILSPDENLRVLSDLVDRFENAAEDPRGMFTLPNTPAFVERLATGTVGFRLTPTRVVAKRKLSQNKPLNVVDTVIAGLEADGPYQNATLAADMRRANEPRRQAQA